MCPCVPGTAMGPCRLTVARGGGSPPPFHRVGTETGSGLSKCQGWDWNSPGHLAAPAVCPGRGGQSGFSGTRVPDESVEEHLSPGPLKSRFHYAAGATARSVARALGGLAQVAMRPLGFNLLSISRQRPGHGVLPHCPLRNSWTNRPCHPVSWYVMAPVSSLQRGLPAEWPARGGDTQIAATQRVGWLQGEGGWQVDVGVEGQWGPGTEYYAPHGGQAPTLPFSLPTTPGSSNASSLPS